MKQNQILTMPIFGRAERVRVLRVYPAGTIDVEVIATGNCYRLTGLSF